MRRFRILFISAVMIAGVSAVAAQDWSGPAAISIQATSRKGGPISGAQVTAKLRTAMQEIGPPPVMTDAKGRVVLANLAQGTWQIEVSHPDFLAFVAVVELVVGKKPDLTASFLQAGGTSLTPMKVKVLRASSFEGPAPPRVAEKPKRKKPRYVEPPTPAPVEEPEVRWDEPVAPAAAEPSQPAPAAEPAEAEPSPRQPAPPAPPPTPEPAAPAQEPTPPPPPEPEPEVRGTVAPPPVEPEPVPSEIEPEPTPVPVTPPPPKPTAAPAVPAPEPEPEEIHAPPAEPQQTEVPVTPPPAEPEPAPAVSEPKAEEVTRPPAAEPQRTEAPVTPPPVEPPPPPVVPEPEPEEVPRPPAAEPQRTEAPVTPPPVEPPPPPVVPEPEEAPLPPVAEPEPPVVPDLPPQLETEPAELPSPPVSEPEPTILPVSPPPPEPVPEEVSPPPVPEPVPRGPAMPAPPPTMPSLSSFRDSSCVECKTGEWAVTSTTVAGAAPAGASAPCPAGLLEAIERVADRLANASELETASFAGPGFDGSNRDAASAAGAAVAREVEEILSPWFGQGHSCQAMAVVLPEFGRFVGFQYDVADQMGSGACLPQQDCEVGQGRWQGSPKVVRGANAQVVYGVFENLSQDRERRAQLTVYFRPPTAFWRPPQ